MLSNRTSRVLIVDDQESNIELMEAILIQHGYSMICSLTDPRKTLDTFTTFQPDLIMLDLLMPYIDGYTLLEQLRARIPEGCYLPILMLTADDTRETRHRALSLGATDFLAKPLDPVEVCLRVDNLLETRRLHNCLQQQNRILEAQVRVRTQALEETREALEQAYDATLEAWSRLLDLRDHETEDHSQRVTELTLQLARAIGVSGEELEHIRRGALLHDIGKMGIPDAILQKPGPLTQEERRIMCQHPVYAHKTLSEISFLRPALAIPAYHHEKWDGSGYPNGLKGEEIPLAARIFAIVDVWDALTSNRPYRPAWEYKRARAQIAALSGTHFDPRIVGVFLALIGSQFTIQPRRVAQMPAMMMA